MVLNCFQKLFCKLFAQVVLMVLDSNWGVFCRSSKLEYQWASYISNF
jgi:hypothetical protein